MAPLRRRTSELLSLVLASCLMVALVGASLVAWRDPDGSLRVALLALVLAAGLTRVLGEGLPTFGVLGVTFCVLGLGLYALHVLFGASFDAILWIGGVLAALVMLILGRALIAAGSADYPYDD